MKTLNPFSRPNIPDLNECVKQFFSYHENVENIATDLSQVETETFLCREMLKALAIIDHNPFV